MYYSLSLALRGLRRDTASTILAAFAISIGIAATVTTTNLLVALTGQPIPGVTDNLYLAWVKTLPDAPSIKLPNNLTKAKFSSMVSPFAANNIIDKNKDRTTAIGEMVNDVSSSDSGRSEKNVNILATTSSFATIFHEKLTYGRFWLKTEEHSRLAVIDEEIARRLFGVADAVGKIIIIKGKSFIISGIIEPFTPQPHFYGLSEWSYSASQHDSVLLPFNAAITADLNLATSDGCPENNLKKKNQDQLSVDGNARDCSWLGLWAYLPDSLEVEQFTSDLKIFSETNSPGNSQSGKSYSLISCAAWLQKNKVVPSSVKLNVFLSFSFLILCMIDASALMTAKFLRRAIEISLRRALGAKRREIFSQHIFESILITIGGAFISIPMILFGIYITHAQAAEYAKLAGLNSRLFLSLIAFSAVIGLITGIIPSWRVSIAEPGLHMKEN